MMLPHFVVWMFSVATLVLGADMVSGQNYPTKPVRIVTSETGGGNDFAARLIAQGLTASLGQQVIVDNRAGGGGVIAAQTVSKAPPDGYTLLLYSDSFWYLPFLRSNVPYDPVRDFLPITLAVSTPNILVVHPSLPVKSVNELIVLAKARPGELNYGTGLPGSATYLAAKLFNTMADVNIVNVSYKGSGPALNAVVAGQVHLIFATAAAVTPHVKSGRLRALAVTSAKPSTLVPGLPTVAASGLPGYESIQMLGIFAGAGTSETLIIEYYLTL